jgi:diguanylate cyclase (GGDEF)-like protein
MSEHCESSYGRQVQAGLSSLRFAAPIEAEFRAQYLARNLEFLRVAAALGLMLIGLSLLLDSQLLEDAAFKSAGMLKLVMGLPLLLLLLSTYPGALMRRTHWFAAAAAAGLSAGTLLLPAVAVPAYDLFAAPVVTMFIYLMLGLRLVPALLFAAPLAAALIVMQMNGAGQSATSAYDTFFLIFANVIGAFCCYRLEHAARSAFLERQIVSILGTSDSATGIPTRRYFNSHLQRVHRQAQRESRSIAIVLVEVNRLGAYRDRYGAPAGDQALRRIAQTVMNCARRPLDFAARFGDSEIALLLFEPDKDRLHSILKRIRDQVALLDIGHAELPGAGHLTVSIGASWLDGGDGHSVQTLLESADRALQEAKGLEGPATAVLPASAEPTGSQVMHGPWAASAKD